MYLISSLKILLLIILVSGMNISGELTTKHSLQGSGRAVISYAQYRAAGSLLPARYDETVSRRWGVELHVGSPIISLAILVPVDEGEVGEGNV
jgi:cadherin EGF LAG seven-pass G-type receptor 1